MLPKWSDSLLTNHADIDIQHREIFKQAELFLDSGRHGRSKEQLDTMLEFLELYIGDHFRMEEDLQIKYNYPYYLAHKAWHDDFKKHFYAFKNRYKASGSQYKLAVEVIGFVTGWLTDHICKTDRAMASFIRNADQPKPQPASITPNS